MPRRFLLAALALLAACTTPTPPPAEPIQLSGTSWRRVDDGDANPHGATMDFADAQASGYTGCNRWFAPVTQNGEVLRFGNVGMTRMACEADVQKATERNFLAVLGHARYAHYDQDALVLLDAQQHVIAEFDSADAVTR